MLGTPKNPRKAGPVVLLVETGHRCTLLFDTQVLTRIGADAKRVRISRTAWLHVSADQGLEGR
jgi:hypothetical protein